jgi:tetratricopeptide (TPR) repeat protein
MSQAFVRVLVVVSMIASLGARSGARPQAPTPVKASADAIRLNNLGVASMNQQKFEAALKYFEDAAGADPSLRVARTNQAIAQLALQRFDPARTLLEAAVKEQPDDVRAWYNLGLLQKSLGDAEASLAAFTRAAELRPRDPHAHYFAGLLGSQLQQYDTAITQFQRALELDPFLVSAEFGLARAFQRAGKTEEARTHMERFSRLTQSKVASAMSLAYGDQGPLSLAEAVQPPPSATPAIPVTFVADAASSRGGVHSGGSGRRAGPVRDRLQRRRRHRRRPPRWRGREPAAQRRQGIVCRGEASDRGERRRLLRRR